MEVKKIINGNINGNLIGKKSDNSGDENVITNATHDGTTFTPAVFKGNVTGNVTGNADTSTESTKCVGQVASNGIPTSAAGTQGQINYAEDNGTFYMYICVSGLTNAGNDAQWKKVELSNL